MRVLCAVMVWVSALAVHGQGTIRYVSIPGYQMPGTELGSVVNELGTHSDTPFDFDGNGLPDIKVRTIGPYEQLVLPAAGNTVLAARSGPMDLSTVVIPLAFGSVIGPASNGQWQWTGTRPSGGSSGELLGPYLASCFDIGCLGLFYQQNAYMGIQFQIDGQLHYGWMHLYNRGAASDVFGFAYNTVPGQPILAGQVPEPGVVALLFAGGGWLCWRCRRVRRSN